MNGPEGPSRCCDDGCDGLKNTQAAMERLGMEETPGCEARTAGEVKVNSKRFGRGAVESGLFVFAYVLYICHDFTGWL